MTAALRVVDGCATLSLCDPTTPTANSKRTHTRTDAQLANVYTAFELQRRLGAKGLQACVADPGAVRTNIYNNSPKLSKGIVNVMINKFYAPPEVSRSLNTDFKRDGPVCAHVAQGRPRGF